MGWSKVMMCSYSYMVVAGEGAAVVVVVFGEEVAPVVSAKVAAGVYVLVVGEVAVEVDVVSCGSSAEGDGPGAGTGEG